jgi:hypothetical protein
MKKPDKCIHYTGTAINEVCAAGVKYADVTDKTTTPHSLPCIGRYNPGGAKCEKCQLPSPGEIEAEEAAMKKRVEGIGKARTAIVAACGGPWKRGVKGSTGVIDCPVCGSAKSLRFSRSGYNGHVGARCMTTDCVSWME